MKLEKALHWIHIDRFIHRRVVSQGIPAVDRPQQSHAGWCILNTGGNMLIGIAPVIGPELLDTLYRMGHGDEIVLADAHFPGETVGKKVLRLDGLRIPDLLDGILPLFALDTYVDSPLMM